MSTQSVVQLKNLITGQSVHCSDLSCNVCLIDLCYPHIEYEIEIEINGSCWIYLILC